MKRSFPILIFISALIFSCTPSKKNIWVIDYEHDLTQEQINKLDSLYKSHEKKTTNEITLVTTPNYGIDTSIELFSKHFWEKYRIGKKDINNGVVIIFSKTQHQIRIATGIGTEKILKDPIAKNIIDYIMTPYFKDAKYFEGIWEGSKAIVAFLEEPENKIK